MNIILSIGLFIFTGYILGEIVEKIKLPRISGYILAGLLLNPDVSGLMPNDFVENTSPLLSISLSFITFSIGGSLTTEKLKNTGKKIFTLTILESFSAFLFVFVGMFLILQFLLPVLDDSATTIAFSLIFASLAAPTDPSATLAVIHENKANGEVSSTMLEIAAFDDIVGIIIYTLAIAFAGLLMGSSGVNIMQTLVTLTVEVLGAVAVGAAIGIIFNGIVKVFNHQPEGTLIVLTLGLVLLSYGISEYFGFESLLATIALGAVVTNFSTMSEEIFSLIERYTDELIFVIFFTLSGLHLQLDSITGSSLLILVYILSRSAGKFFGVFAGGNLTNLSKPVKRFTAGGLIPQGGIVIGLALLLKDDPAFEEQAPLVIGIVVGSALIHEIIGPIASKFSLKKAGEIL